VSEPVWIGKLSLTLLQLESLAEHGGMEGLRDEGLLESALARPQNLFAYEGVTDLARLAAAYGLGIVRNHPFVDGNKRAGLLAIALFLGRNGRRLQARKADATLMMFAAAEGDLGEEEMASWIREHMIRAER
jgi:death on curing protein